MSHSTTSITEYIDETYVTGSPNPRHKVDIYVPKHRSSNLPLVVYVHGGSWRSGDKSEYGGMAKKLIQISLVEASSANNDQLPFAVAVINYTLSIKEDPSIIHPAHLDDCVKAIDYLIDNSSKYGYDGTNVHLVGHSAGAHLTGLLALNPPSHWELRGSNSVNGNHIRSVSGVSGIYDIPALLKRWPSYLDFIDMGFGKDKSLWRVGSPQYHPLVSKTTAKQSRDSDTSIPLELQLCDNGVPQPATLTESEIEALSKKLKHQLTKPLIHLRYLVIHSVEDQLVDLDQSQRYAQHLQQQGLSKVEFQYGKWEDHFEQLQNDKFLTNATDQPDVYETPDLIENNETVTQNTDLTSFDPNVITDGINTDEALERFQKLSHNTKDSDEPKDLMARHKRAMMSRYLIESFGPGEKNVAESVIGQKDESVKETLARLSYETSLLSKFINEKANMEIEEDISDENKSTLLGALKKLERQLAKTEEAFNKRNSKDGGVLDENLLKLLSESPAAKAEIEKQLDKENNKDKGTLGKPSTQSIANLEERITLLERILGAKQSNLLNTTSGKGVLESIADMEERVILISDPKYIDGLSRRVKQLTVEIDRLNELKKKSKGADSPIVGTGDGKSGNSNSSALNLDQGTVDRINDLYESVNKIEAVVRLAPALASRLESLAQVHSEAAVATETLKRCDESGQRVDEGIIVLTDLCQTMTKSIIENSEIMRDNIKGLDKRMADLDKRISKLTSLSVSSTYASP
ncbi:hypothetical protein H4219_003231 [Mycoemilia scoparia]|uniref:BD-FAE-like domain-containing protein n=1 Tax=Mycoemilia scoparia TaxID=417184 RepID=A0A9W8A3B4_9FUNG|nr:hypothetical protein H4219_003231 [Mycoemilia scoparia]